MKKLGWLLCLLLLFVGCVEKAPEYLIGVSQCSDDEWRHQMNSEMLREALFYEGVDVEIRTVKDNNRKQVEDIRYFIDKGVDLLIVAPNEAAPITPIVEEAYSKDIPVIVVDRRILSDKYTAFVGADNFEIGRSVGEYLVSRFPKGGNIVELSGLAGSSPAIDRHQGFTSIINRHPSMNLLTTEDAGWNKEDAVVVMDSILNRFPNIDVVFAQNDRMAYGAYQTTLQQGREKEMEFLGIDALSGDGYGIDMVLEGILSATFIYPTGGDRVIQVAMDILEGRPFERETILSTAVIGQSNARIMKLQTDHIGELDNKIRLLNLTIDRNLDRYANQQTLLYASLLILALLLFIGGFILKAYRTKLRLNRELSQKHKEVITQKEQLEEQRDQLLELSKQLEEATHAKLVFFTNISHDFRTPLTLISDPVNRLLEDKLIPPAYQESLKLVQRNANILLRLVNQILDFRKYENGKLDLTLIRFDLAEQIKEWTEAFREIAVKRNIRFQVEVCDATDFTIIGDLGKIERVCFNLLSNAFKFTPENGKINLFLSATEKNGVPFVRVKVKDTGAGISPEHLTNIFERFYMTNYQIAGSGIGLALTKSFIHLHGGNITVESKVGVGSEFTFSLPYTQTGYTEMETYYAPLEKQEDTTSVVDSLVVSTAEEDEKENLSGQKILIIDDNADIRGYLKSLLGDEFVILEATHGKEGIDKASGYVPDLIICDIMMPVMDGMECCHQLKSGLQTSHIPVIMLTACTQDEQKIKGFETGADAYISKPFNSNVLIARVKNLLENRKRLQEVFGDPISLSKENISTIDKSFVEKFRELVEENLSDSTLGVEELGEKMGMSRVQLYRKVKSLTNYSPNEFIRITRLRKASQLLNTTNMTISEITYEVGFTSPSYFTKCYRDHFNESPTEFLRKKK